MATAGVGVGPARSSQPQPGPKGARGVPSPWGAAPQRGPACGQGSGGQSTAGTWDWGWRAPSASLPSLFICPHPSPLVFLILTFSSRLLFLLFLSSSSSSHFLSLLLGCLLLLLSSPLLLLAFTSFSSSLLDLSLFSSWLHHLLGPFLLSTPSSLPGDMQLVTTARFRAGGGHSSLSSPQLATALPRARVDVPGVGQDCAPSPGHRGPSPACPVQPVKTNRAEPTMSGHLSRGIQSPQA